MKFLCLLLLPLVLAQDCVFDSPLGKFDFSSHIDAGTMGPVVDTSSIFSTYLSICHDGTQACQLEPEMALRYQTPTFCSSVVGKWETPTWELIDPNDKAGGVKQTFANGDLCFGQVTTEPSKTTIEFMCDPTAPGNTFTTTSDNFQCDWTFIVPSAHACGTDGGGSGGAGGLSGGWIFVIIVLVCSFVYVVVGFAYKTRALGTSGAESIPNIDFWRQLPGLVKDGGSYTWGLIRGPNYQKMGGSSESGGTGGEYQQSGF